MEQHGHGVSVVFEGAEDFKAGKMSLFLTAGPVVSLAITNACSRPAIGRGAPSGRTPLPRKLESPTVLADT